MSQDGTDDEWVAEVNAGLVGETNGVSPDGWQHDQETIAAVPPGVTFSADDAAFWQCCSTTRSPKSRACGWFDIGLNSRCVCCDHERLCHAKGCWPAKYDRDQLVAPPPEFTSADHQLVIERCTKLESAINEWVAASDMPARSSDAGETSVWMARSVSAENALRALVGAGPKEPQATGLLERARLLEAESREARNLLAAAIDTIDAVHSSGLVSCATRAARLIRWAAELRAALAGVLAQRRTSEGYATAEEQDVVREARRVLGTGGRL